MLYSSGYRVKEEKNKKVKREEKQGPSGLQLTFY